MYELQKALFQGLETREGYVGDRPTLRAMDALDKGRMAVPDKSLPGLGPTLAEAAAQKSLDLRQSLQFPKEREATPIVGRPERMSADRNAELFPSGASNDMEKVALIVAATDKSNDADYER